MDKHKKLFYILNHIEEILLVLCIATTVILIALQVSTRYIFNNSLTWTEELARYLFIWESWIGISIGAKKGKHIKIEIITSRLKGKVQFIVLTLADICTLAIIAVLIYYGVDLTDKVYSMMTTSASLKIPMWLIYLALPTGCSLMAIRIIADIVNRFRNIPKEGVEPF